MEVEFDFDRAEKTTSITASPGSYDAPVLRPVRLYGCPLTFNSDRLYVASALLFGEEISGSLAVKEHLCSRHVGIQIARYFSPVDVFVENQTLDARAIPGGQYEFAIALSTFDQEFGADCDSSQGNVRFRLVTEGVGAIFSEHEISIGTNVTSSDEMNSDMIGVLVKAIGLSILFAQDLHISAICVKLPEGADPADERLARVSDLLLVVGLSLSIA